MSKIALIDLFFYWPPGGGSHVDVKEVAQRLAREHEVRFFVPNIREGVPFKALNMDFILKRTKFFNRGKTDGSLNFDIVPIEFDAKRFCFKNVPQAFFTKIDEFCPDIVFITQGSFLKPYLINRISEKYPVTSRYYSNECFCLKGDGQYFKFGKICKVDPLSGRFSDYLKCLACSSSFLLGYPSPLFIHEYALSKAFMPSHLTAIKKSLRNCTHIMVYNRFIKEKLLRFNESVSVVPGGVNISSFSGNGDKTGGKLKIFMMGRSDDPAKGFETLFEAGKMLWNERKDFSIQVTVRDKLRSKYRLPFVENMGWIPHAQMPELISGCDIVVVPSKWPEPFGIAAVEAMACSKPVVAGKVGGLQDIVSEGKSGFLIDPHDPQQLKERLETLLNNPDLRKKMGDFGYEQASGKYDWDIVYKKFYRPLFSSDQ